MSEPVTEYGLLMSGGGFQVRWNDPEIEDIYPTPRWIENTIRTGGHVRRRRVIVVDDWTEVQAAPPGGGMMSELDDAEVAIAAADCEHHWVSGHEPGHIVYWVRVCSICRHVDWDDLDREIRQAVTDRLFGSTANCEERNP